MCIRDRCQREGVRFPQLIGEDRNYHTPPPVIPDESPRNASVQDGPGPTTVIGNAVPAAAPAVSQGMPNLTEAKEQADLFKDVLQTLEPGANIQEMDFVLEMAAAVRQAQAGIQENAESVNDEPTLMRLIATVDSIDQALEVLSTFEAVAPAPAPAPPPPPPLPAVVVPQEQYNPHQAAAIHADSLDQFDAQADLYVAQEEAKPVSTAEDDLMDLFAPTSIPTIPSSNLPPHQICLLYTSPSPRDS
eukprot:TRINITY_DN7395_c0_g1_i3.p1 TRINITY_DN7395_c0_g1~~TRINITY_DN7395_c0_g1_i3.p1  ORF type:complete len:246 (-),score=52.46 TRINITY_DN7395_c0_g1_i3:106-843(-)